GSLLANADQQTQEYYYELGKNIGLAFQIHDDILGIWGNPEETGKSTSTDLIARKKSLPILFGLAQNGEFSKLWEENISPENVSIL
ncbi:MAG: polyprenyl synthetase family protein, partial [Aliifodinibius sp.]|nr:polyprenyl synthetase family protein [Fodinibius sp.]